MNNETLKRNWRIIKRKKWPIVIAVLLIIAIITAPIFYTLNEKRVRFTAKSAIPLNTIYVKHTDRDRMHLYANRGFSCQAPENTIPAIESAAKFGFKSVEIDVRLTQDGVWVLMHDDTVNSMTDKRGSVSSYTYFDLVTCNINNGANHKNYKDLKIPTLEQAMKACLENNITPLIVLKNCDDDGVKKLASLIEVNGFTKSCAVVSDDREMLKKLHKKNDEIKLYALVDKLSKKEMKKALDTPEIGIVFDAENKATTKKKIKQLIENKNPIICRTVDDSQTFKKMYGYGVTDFITNRIFDK